MNKKKDDSIEESTEVTEDVREELLPPDEALPAPDLIKENTT